MNTQIIELITELKRNYENKNNTYDIQFLDLEETYFVNIIKKLLNDGYKNVKIIDDKEYINNGMVFNVDIHGNMKCKSRKMLKYKYIDNIKVSLFNDRNISVDNFTTTNKYKDSYKQKRMIFKIYNFDFILIIKTRKKNTVKKDEEKTETKYEIKISFNTKEDENKLVDLFKYI